jgi:alkylhydroperoxidase/carboxymuconolactone decarboxylase family protein YurZ
MSPTNHRRPNARPVTSPKPSSPPKVDVKAASPYGYAFWDWLAREDPEYVRARQPISALSVGEGKALSIKYREMVILGILLFRGASSEGIHAHMRRAIQHGATKRELLEAVYAAAVPGGGPTLSNGVKALMELDEAGAFKNG